MNKKFVTSRYMIIRLLALANSRSPNKNKTPFITGYKIWLLGLFCESVLLWSVLKRERAETIKSPKPTRKYRNPVFVASELQEKLRSTSSSTSLSRDIGVSKARVTQFLNLLKLDKDSLEVVRNCGDPMDYPIITERTLRPLVNLSNEEQRKRISALIYRGNNI
ncbi:MAG: hypothetical protein PHT33_14640 [bacterium]|nr:hypothetical protein [bacterium]